MDCHACLERFDAARRRPKVLPCGHSACLACLEGLRERRCPECRREFQPPARDLVDNLALLEGRESGSPRGPRMWCIDCKAIARPECFEGHTLKSAKSVLKEEAVQLQVRAAQLADQLPEALHQDGDDGHPDQALRVLQLARQPGTTLEVSVRGQRGEALTATWTNPPAAAPVGQQGAAEAVQAVATDVLVLALAKEGAWQQRGVKRGHEGEEGQPKQGRSGSEATTQATTLDLPVVQMLDVGVGWNPTDQRKAELLQIVGRSRVKSLDRVCCDSDPAWSLQLLQLAAPHLEELMVSDIHRDHFLAVLAMPRLRWLLAFGCGTPFQTAELPPLPPHCVGLQWLGVYALPLETTFDLVRAHAGTLEELELTVVPPGDGEKWPWGCDDLPAALGRCGFARLSKLKLATPIHDGDRCPAQIDAVRGALPQVQVECICCGNQ